MLNFCECGKVAYRDRSEAMAVMLAMKSRERCRASTALTVYQCRMSSVWHLGHAVIKPGTKHKHRRYQ